jgi:ribosomal protein L11 methyltransferase
VKVTAYIPADERAQDTAAHGREALSRMARMDLGFDAGKLTLEVNSMDDEDWAENWKSQYKPFRLGETFVVKPTWEPYAPKPGDRVIEIDPGMAFGSGTHETTGMCISLLEETIHGGESIIDVGTGSGILAIAAALLGAGRVLAIDIDPDAVRVAGENVVHNQVENIVEVREGDLLKNTQETCEICVANIISDIIISFAAPLRNHIRPGGLFICSGIVRERTEEVREALLRADYEILKTEHRGEWTAFLCRRNS